MTAIPTELSASEVEAITAFLRSLTGRQPKASAAARTVANERARRNNESSALTNVWVAFEDQTQVDLRLLSVSFGGGEARPCAKVVGPRGRPRVTRAGRQPSLEWTARAARDVPVVG